MKNENKILNLKFEQPKARAQVEWPQVKYICIKGVKIHLWVEWRGTADNLVWQVIYVRPRNIPAFCADLLEARLVERRPGDHGRQPTTREAA
jgi:hypothetical protein